MYPFPDPAELPAGPNRFDMAVNEISDFLLDAAGEALAQKKKVKTIGIVGARERSLKLENQFPGRVVSWLSDLPDLCNWLQSTWDKGTQRDIVILLGPGSGLIPPIDEYGGVFPLAKNLSATDHAWLVRPNSFFLQLIEDDWSFHPQDSLSMPEDWSEFNAFWPVIAEFWWQVRLQFDKYGYPYRRGSAMSGWAELSAHLFQHGYHPARIETTPKTRHNVTVCTIDEALVSERHHGLKRLRSQMPGHANQPTHSNLRERLRTAILWKTSAEIWRFDAERIPRIQAHLITRSSEYQNRLAAALRHTPSPTGGLSASNEGIVVGGGAIRATMEGILQDLFEFAAPQGTLPVQQPESHRGTMTDEVISGDREPTPIEQSAEHRDWLDKRRISFCLVRWQMVDRKHDRPQMVDFYPKLGRLPRNGFEEPIWDGWPPLAQRIRMEVYLKRIQQDDFSGFTNRFVGGDSPFQIVGIEDRYPKDQFKTPRLPWLLHTSDSPLQWAFEYLRNVFRAFFNAPNASEARFRHMLRNETAVAEAQLESKYNTDKHLYHKHYLTWFYEYILGFPLAHKLERTPQSSGDSLASFVDTAVSAIKPALLFPVHHFYALTNIGSTDVVTQRKKLVTISLGLNGTYLRAGDCLIIRQLANTLGELRTTDDTMSLVRRTIDWKLQTLSIPIDAPDSLARIRREILSFTVHEMRVLDIVPWLRALLADFSSELKSVLAKFDDDRLLGRFRSQLAFRLPLLQQYGHICLTLGRPAKRLKEVAFEFYAERVDELLPRVEAAFDGIPCEIHVSRSGRVAVYLAAEAEPFSAESNYWVVLRPGSGRVDWLTTATEPARVLGTWATCSLFARALDGQTDFVTLVSLWNVLRRSCPMIVSTSPVSNMPAIRLSNQNLHDWSELLTTDSQSRAHESLNIIYGIDHDLPKFSTIAPNSESMAPSSWNFLRQSIARGVSLLNLSEEPDGLFDFRDIMKDAVACAIQVAGGFRETEISPRCVRWQHCDGRRLTLEMDEIAEPIVRCRRIYAMKCIFQLALNSVKHCRTPGEATITCFTIVHDEGLQTFVVRFKNGTGAISQEARSHRGLWLAADSFRMAEFACSYPQDEFPSPQVSDEYVLELKVHSFRIT